MMAFYCFKLAEHLQPSFQICRSLKVLGQRCLFVAYKSRTPNTLLTGLWCLDSLSSCSFSSYKPCLAFFFTCIWVSWTFCFMCLKKFHCNHLAMTYVQVKWRDELLFPCWFDCCNDGIYCFKLADHFCPFVGVLQVLYAQCKSPSWIALDLGQSSDLNLYKEVLRRWACTKNL